VFLPHLAVDPAGVEEADLGAAAVQTGPDMHVCVTVNCAFRRTTSKIVVLLRTTHGPSSG
jgi:hypothetical protein